MEFGRYLNFDRIMDNGLILFENNIIQLKKLIGIEECQIDIFILTHNEGIEKVDKIKEILNKHNIRLLLISYWEKLKNYYNIDKERLENYKNIFKPFIKNENHCPLGYDNKNYFNPGSLWYRRYLIYKFYDHYIRDNNLEKHDLLCITRLFSTKIICLKKILNISENILYFSPDTFFMASNSNIQKLVQFGKKGLFNADKNDKNILIMKEDNKFLNYCYEFDNIIASHFFCSEIQILYYIYNNFKHFKNIRLDNTKYKDNNIINKILYGNDYPDKNLLNLDIFVKTKSFLLIRICK